MPNSFSIIKKGYAPQEVDRYIRELEESIASYKANEQYISSALVESHITSKQILEDAEIRAFEIEKDALIQLEHFKHELNHTKKRLQSFKNDYDTFIGNFKVSFNDSEIASVMNTLGELSDKIDKHVKN